MNLNTFYYDIPILHEFQVFFYGFKLDIRSWILLSTISSNLISDKLVTFRRRVLIVW